MDRLLPRLLAALSVVAMGLWLVLALVRVGHPFELEWQEGGMLAHLHRLRAGQGLYAAPSLEFMAFPYPPLYHWAAAGVAVLLGEGFAALRVVSILATLATLALIGVYVRRDTGSAVAGLVGAGLYAAAYRFGGAWTDVGRVDALALALGLGALTLARFRRGMGAAALAGLVAALALLTKQTAVGFALPIALALALRDRREAAVFAATASAVTGAVLLFLHRGSDGWSTWYLFDLLGGHPTFAPKVWGFWTEDMLLLAPTLFAVLAGLPPAGERPGRSFLALAALGLVGVSWLGRAHQGGYDNTLLPAVLVASLLAGRAAGRALRRRSGAAIGVLALLTGQLLLLGYDPRAQIPGPRDVAAGERVVAELEGIEGPVFAPYQGYLAERAGKGPSLHAMGLIDLLSSAGNEDRARALVADLERTLAEGRYGAVLLAEPFEGLLALERHYRLERSLFDPSEPDLFQPVTGARRRPELLYVPRR